MIVIVGAGLAGLSAAMKLTEANYDDFIIVEAQNRIGGRIQSVGFDDGSRIDLGAQWLHGEKQNPLYSWLESLDCIEGPEDDEVEFEGLFVTQTGEAPPKNVISKVLDILLETKKFLYDYGSLTDAHCKPVDVFRKRVMDEIATCSILKSANPNLIQAVIRWFQLYEAIDNSCLDLSDLSMKAYSNWTNFDDGKMVKLKDGWQGVVDKIVKTIGKDKILLDHRVKRVNYTDTCVNVVLRNNKIISCDHVIISVSVGVLKKLLRGNFLCPYIGAKRRAQIDGVGFGPADKIFLQFDRPYLPEERGLKLLWLKNDSSQADLQMNTFPRWAQDVIGFDLIHGADNFLLAWIGCRGAIEAEGCSDTEVAETCMKLLRAFLPNKDPPNLISITRSKWSTNPQIGGAYSYQSVATFDEDIAELWEPIYTTSQESTPIPRVLFAGEATAGEMYATAHGAIISGWREAERLLAILGTRKRRFG